MVYRHFLPFYRLSHSVDGFVVVVLLWFDVVPLVYFCICCLYFRVISKKSLPRLIKEIFPYLFTGSFAVSDLTFKSSFQVNFCEWYQIGLELS